MLEFGPGEKDKRTAETIRAAILSNEFLRQLDSEEIGQMIDRMRPVQMEVGTQIVRQGELSSELFVLEEGRVQVTKDRRFVRIMEGPCVFGELAILYHCERTATVIALSHCRLWALHRTAFHTVMVHNAKSRQEQSFNHLKRSPKLPTHFGCRQLSTLLGEGQLLALAGQVREEFWQLRTEVERTQIRGRIYVITKGRITVRRRPSNDSPPELSVLTVGDAIGLGRFVREDGNGHNGLL
uniref:Cyclic nucleotide-binding domain-containing protein n=1 Tax=Globodera pallida TaxID=36090 RepID=A0A183CDR6_GLOPA